MAKEEIQPHTLVQGFMGRQQAEKDAEGNPRPVIVQNITVRPVNRRIVDIEAWRSALRAAEASVPRRVELYDLYDELMLDTHLTSVVEKRLMGITNIEWEFLDANGKEVPAIKEWIDSPDFEKTVSEILNSKVWGYTMLEFDFYEDGSWGVFLVPRKHMRPELGLVSYEQTANSGINIREGIYADTVLEAGHEKDLGLLLKAAAYVIYKRGNFGDWAQFIERFGQPLIDAIWDGYDESQRVMLLKALENMGAGGQIVRPAGTQLQFLQGGSNNPTGQLNDSFNNACNAEISKLFLGQTETTESSASSGYAQASVHGETESDINVSDRNFVRRILNKRVVKILEANGVQLNGGTFSIKINKDDVEQKKSRLEIDLRLKNEAQIPISDDYFYETYGIEKPEDYEAQKQALKEKAAQQQFGGGGGFNMALPDLLAKLRDAGFFFESSESDRS
jgi:hypothetical protein